VTTTSTTSSSGIGVTGLLGVAFVVLKLTHFIDWPWKWVLAPFWIPATFLAIVLFLLALAWLVKMVVDRQSAKRHRGLP
jgi:hypothetical protein